MAELDRKRVFESNNPKTCFSVYIDEFKYKSGLKNFFEIFFVCQIIIFFLQFQ